MGVYGITWNDINGNSNFVFDANINSVRTWITVSTDTTESVVRKFQVTMYRGVAGGGQAEVTTLTAKYVRTENNVRLYQAEYIFNVADWLQFRPNDNNYVTVWVNTPESLYTSATVKYMYMPTINSIRITSSLPDSSIFVQNVTPFNIEVEAEGYDGATIQAVTADIQSTANPLTEVDGVWSGTRRAYTSYGTVEFWVRATDQYQVTKLQTVKLSVKKHDVPAITTDIYRCDLDGTKNENGAYLSVTAYASSVPTALGIYSLYLEGTIIGASSSIIAQYINSGQTYILGNGGITSNDSYNLTFTATDKAAIYGGTALSVSVIVGVPKVVRVINVKDGGTGVAFGKLATEDELVDTDWGVRATAFRCRQKTKTSQVGMTFHTLDGTRNGQIGMNIYTTGDNVSLYRYNFREYSLDTTTGLPLATYETFRMPAPTFDRTDNGTYDIITTKNLTDIPDASATARGLVSTGAQTFAGAKKFLERPTVSGSIRYPGINYVSTNGSSLSNRVGLEYIDTGSATFGQMGDACWSVEVYGNDGNGGISPYRERYLLPFVTVGRTNNANYNILTSKSAVTIAQGGTGQTGQTAQQSYTPTVKIGSTAQTVSSLSAYYKSWGLMKLIGGRFNLTTTGTGQLIISLPTGFTVPTSAVQPMGILIAPDQKAYHIRVSADGLAAMSNGGGNVAWATGYYCFWAVVMGN